MRMMSLRNCISVCLVGLSLIGCGGGGGNGLSVGPVLENPGFESEVLPAGTFEKVPKAQTIWTGTAGFGLANGSGSWGTAGHSGNQYAYLQSANAVDTDQGSMQQTVSGFVVGATYHVTFWMARRNGNVGGNVGEPIRVLADSNLILPSTAPTNDGLWGSVTTGTFVATSSVMTITITTDPPGIGQDQATLIDDVAIVSG
jgi:hypothetical protein